MKRKKLLSHAILLCSGIFCSSCFGLRIDAKVLPSGRVEAALQYTISVAALELSINESKALYIPITIDGTVFADRVLANSGELASWSVQNRTDSYFVDTRVIFPNMLSFVIFLDAEQKLIQFTNIENVSKLSVSIPDTKKEIDPEFLKFLETAFTADSIELSMELPKPPRSSKGFKVDRTKAAFFGTSAMFFSAKPGSILELSW